MKEEDPTKPAELFGRYRAEHLNDRDDTDGDAKEPQDRGASAAQEQASGSHQPAAYPEAGVEKITEGNIDP